MTPFRSLLQWLHLNNLILVVKLLDLEIFVADQLMVTLTVVEFLQMALPIQEDIEADTLLVSLLLMCNPLLPQIIEFYAKSVIDLGILLLIVTTA